VFENFIYELVLKVRADRGNDKRPMVLFMDNATIHRYSIVIKTVLGMRVFLLYTPQYSPQLNPVEKFFKYVKSNLVVNTDALGRNNLLSAAKTSMSSKIIGSESDFFANLAVTAATRVKFEKDGKVKCPIGNVHVLKSHGQSALDSELVDGFALNCARASSAMPTRITNVKVALLDFNLQKHKLQMGVQVWHV
jgi:transposase